MQNIKKYCERKGVKPTPACKESGVGSSFINNILARGQIPSVEKVQLLAQYLDVTTSELLGEKEIDRFPIESGRAIELFDIFEYLNEEGQEKLLGYAKDLADTGKYIKSSASGVGSKEA